VQQHPAGSSDVAASLTVVAEHPAAKASKRASVFMGVSIGAHHHHGARRPPSMAALSSGTA